MRLEVWAEVGQNRAKLPLVCASVRPDASGVFVLSELALGDLSVHLPAPPAGPFALLGNHWPTQGAARPCPYGDSLGARRGWHMVLPGPGPHLLPLPLGRFSLVLVDLGSDARSTHDLAVDGAQTLHLPAPIPPQWVEFTLLRNGQPLCGRSFQWLGAPAGWESVSGVTDSTGGSRVPLEPGATGRLLVAGDEGLAAASVHELGALAGRQLIDVPPPATLRLAAGHPWTVSARPLWTSASFFRGSAGLPLAGLLQARLPAPSDALLLSPGTWDVELNGPGGTHTLQLSLYPGETREWAPGR